MATPDVDATLDALSDLELDQFSNAALSVATASPKAVSSDAELDALSTIGDAMEDALDAMSDDGASDAASFLDALSDVEFEDAPQAAEDGGRLRIRDRLSAVELAQNAAFFRREAQRKSSDGVQIVDSSSDEAQIRPGSIAHARSCRRQSIAEAAQASAETRRSLEIVARMEAAVSAWGDRAMALWQSAGSGVQMLLSTLSGPQRPCQDETYSADISAITDRHLRRHSGPRLFSSLRAEMCATRCGSDLKTYKARKNEVAEVTLLASRLFLGAFFRKLVEAKKLMPDKVFIELVHFLTFADETPAKFRVREVVDTPMSEAIVPASGPVQSTAKFEKHAAKQTAKVVQAEMRVAIVTRRVDESGLNHYAHYSCELPCSLSTFDHNTADNLWAWYCNLLSIPGFEKEILDTHVERKCATTVMDLAASNTRMINYARHHEKNLDGKGWRRLQFCCQVHRIQTSQGYVYDLVSLHISAMIALALSLTNSGTFGKLKRALGWVMTLILEWHGPDEDHPNDDCSVQRQALLDACIPEPRGTDDEAAAIGRKRRVIYSALVTGDPSELGVLPHFCKRGCCKNKADTARKLRNELVWAIMPHAPKPFPVHHWTGSDVVVRMLTLLANTHGLLMMVVPLWAKLAKAKNEFKDVESVKKFVETELHLVVSSGDEDSDLSEGQVAGQPRRAWGGRRRGGKAKSSRDDVATDFAQRARRHRAEVKSWAREHPDTPLAIIMKSIQPGATLMYSFLRRAGVEWDIKTGVDCLESGDLTWRLLREHDGTVFEDYAQRIATLLTDEAAWDLIPGSRMTLEARSLAYRCISRSAATIWLLLVHPCSGYPHKLFSVLGPDPLSKAEDIFADAEDLYDDFTIWFVSEFNTPELLSGELALQLLLAIANDVRDEISRIESRNAQISHASRLRSGHMTSEEMPDMGAGFFLQRARAAYDENFMVSGKTDAEGTPERKRPGPRPSVMKRPASAPTRRKGAWRSYLSERSEAQNSHAEFGGDFSHSASADYAVVSPAEKRRLALVGDSQRASTVEVASAPQGPKPETSEDPLAAAVGAYLDDPSEDARGRAGDSQPVLAIVPHAGDLESAKLQIVGQSREETAAKRRLQEAAASRLAEHARSDSALATVEGGDRKLGSLFAKPSPTRFANTAVFEVVPPIADFVNDVFVRAGPPRFDQKLFDVFGYGSFHERMRESWARRHGTWKHSEQKRLPAKVDKSPGNASVCRAYGVCICAEPALQAFLTKFTCLLKSLHAKSSKWAACVDAGGCVLEFRVVDEAFDVVSRQRCHLAYVNYASWAVGLVHVSRSTNRICIDTAAVFGNEAARVALPPSVGGGSAWQTLSIRNAPLFLRSLDFGQLIMLRMHEIVGGKRVAASKVPGELELKWIGGDIEFWKGKSEMEVDPVAPIAAPPSGPEAADPPAPHNDGDPEHMPIMDGDPYVEEVARDWAAALEAQLELYAAQTVSHTCSLKFRRPFSLRAPRGTLTRSASACSVRSEYALGMCSQGRFKISNAEATRQVVCGLPQGEIVKGPCEHMCTESLRTCLLAERRTLEIFLLDFPAGFSKTLNDQGRGRVSRIEASTPPELADYTATPGVPQEPVSRRRTRAEMEDLEELRAAARPRLPGRLRRAADPPSPGSDFEDLQALNASSGDDAAKLLGNRARRGRGGGRGGRRGRPVQEFPLVHVSAAGAPEPQDAALGRGRGGRGQQAPGVARDSRPNSWGKPQWSFGKTATGWTAHCRCHRNHTDLPGVTTHCKKVMCFSIRDPISDDESRRLCKVWLICGLDAEADDTTQRSAHVFMNPRDVYQDWSEEALDDFASTLSCSVPAVDA